MRYFRSMIKEFFDMSYITITTEKNETYSSISNFFIDYYMTSASGEFVKEGISVSGQTYVFQ